MEILMTDEIATTDDGALTLASLQQNTAVGKHSDEEFDSLKTSSFLSRVQLMTANAAKCKSGEFPINHYAIVDGSTFHDIGKEVDCLVLGWRPKALEIDDEILTVYDPKDAEFERIKDRADNEKDSGCMWGFEFLLWLGQQKRFTTFFCGSKSARREAPNMKALLNGAATLRSKLIETKKFSWQGIVVVACSTPMPMPSNARFQAELEKFNNPPAPTTERVEDAGRAV